MFVRIAALAACAGAAHATFFNRVMTQTTKAVNSDYTVHTDTYYSIAMDLGPGEMVFTEASSTPLAMPDAGLTGYSILAFSGEIVDGNNESAPLSECCELCAFGASHVGAAR